MGEGGIARMTFCAGTGVGAVVGAVLALAGVTAVLRGRKVGAVAVTFCTVVGCRVCKGE